MKKPVRTGFTLVELLIVIAVIGILSSMMMLSSTETVASAKAANIISDMMTIRTAALAYLADHVKDINKAGKTFNLSDKTPDVMKYVDPSTLHDNKYLLFNYFGVGVARDEDEWYVWRKVTDSKVKEKLRQRAQGLNLLATHPIYGNTPKETLDAWSLTGVDAIVSLYVDNGNRVWVGMRIY